MFYHCVAYLSTAPFVRLIFPASNKKARLAIQAGFYVSHSIVCKQSIKSQTDYSAKPQPLMCLLPSSTIWFNVASTSISPGALKVQVFLLGLVLISATPSTPSKAARTERAQPPQVMFGSFKETA